MKFTPKTEKEIAEEKLLPVGDYPFQISAAEDYVSKAGNEMIKAEVRVFKPDGNFLLVDDYLGEFMMHKILHLCQATGLEDDYNAGLIKPENLVGKTGQLKLSIQKDKTGQYPDRNSIKDYIVGADLKIPKTDLDKLIDGDKDDLADEIPF